MQTRSYIALAALGLALCIAGSLTGSRAPGQALPPLGPNTVYGRLGISAGPPQAIPFASFVNNLLGSLNTITGDVTFTTSGVATAQASLVNTTQLYTAPGTGGAAQTLQSRLQNILHSKDYGTAGNGIADDTTALQNWINECQTLSATCWLDAGTYKTSSALNITAAITVIGAGRTTAVLAPSSATQDTIVVNTSQNQGLLANFGVAPSVTMTAGAAIRITSPSLNYFWTFEHLSLGFGDNVYYGIEAQNSADQVIHDVQITCALACIYAPAGFVSKAFEDAYVSDSLFQTGANSANGVLLNDVSGFKLVNSKILNNGAVTSTNGVVWTGSASCTACSDLLLANNSIETNGYAFLMQGGSVVQMDNIILSGNELNGTGSSVVIASAGTFGVQIAGNGIFAQGAPTGISFTSAVTKFNISHNLIVQCTTCISISNASAQGSILDNTITNATTTIASSSSSVLISDRNGIATGSLPSAANGSQLFASDADPATSPCTHAGAQTGSTAFRQNGAWKCF